MSSAKFKARIIVEDGDTQEVEVWDDDLSPFGKDGRCSVREWVKNHFDDYNNESLRELLELPAEGNYEVLIEADINGYHSSSPNGDDYDEDLTIHSIKQQKIPESWYGGVDFSLSLVSEERVPISGVIVRSEVRQPFVIEGAEAEGLDRYDAGLLGGNGDWSVDQWHNYLRSELGRAHEFYNQQVTK